MPPASCNRPSGYTSRAPTRPASGRLSNTASSASSQPAVTWMSLLSSTRNSPRAAAAPRLQLAMKPPFTPARSQRTPSTPAIACAAGCGEASSTTMTSTRSSAVKRARLRRQLKVWS